MAYRLSKQGHKVTLFEKESQLGGLLSTFHTKEFICEKFYHHFFTTDKAFLKLLRELNLKSKINLKKPPTGFYYDKQLFPLNNLRDFFHLPELNYWDKLKALILTGILKFIPYRLLPNRPAAAWLSKIYGQKIYHLLWYPLLSNKFGPRHTKVNLYWFWSRLHNRSPKLGYLQGSFQTLIDALTKNIQDDGGVILQKNVVYSITKNQANFTLTSNVGNFTFDQVIVTTAPQIFRQIASDVLPKNYQQKFLAQEYLASNCLVLELKKPFSPYYWTNIQGPNFPFVALIEQTNFPGQRQYPHLLYINRYAPADDHFTTINGDEHLNEILPYLQKINPAFKKSWIIKFHRFIDSFAQPICHTNYQNTISPFHTPIENLHFVSMAQIFPHDRGLNYAIRLADDYLKGEHK